MVKSLDEEVRKRLSEPSLINKGAAGNYSRTTRYEEITSLRGGKEGGIRGPRVTFIGHKSQEEVAGRKRRRASEDPVHPYVSELPVVN